MPYDVKREFLRDLHDSLRITSQVIICVRATTLVLAGYASYAKCDQCDDAAPRDVQHFRWSPDLLDLSPFSHADKILIGMEDGSTLCAKSTRPAMPEMKEKP